MGLTFGEVVARNEIENRDVRHPSDALTRAMERRDPNRWSRYRTDPIGYMREIMEIEPWSSSRGGQLELLHDIGESVENQLRGVKSVPKTFRIAAGQGCGKTYISAGLVNWFFDCFVPGVTITTAPTFEQVNLLLWKNLKTMRAAAISRGHNLLGRILPKDPRLESHYSHFAIGRTTSDAGGQGSARAQGQHERFMFFVIDEAEGVEQYQYDAINAMLTGGDVMLWLMIANPQTRNSAFHKYSMMPNVRNYTWSLLDTPNVKTGRTIVPGSTSREWVCEMIASHCEVVDHHNEDKFTFELPWDVPYHSDGQQKLIYRRGTVFAPDPEFQFRVLGVPPVETSGYTLIPSQRFELAKTRSVDTSEYIRAQIGVDCARGGSDKGKIYRYQAQTLHFEAELQSYADQKDITYHYTREIIKSIGRAIDGGAQQISVRIDGSGGYGGGIIDALYASDEIAALGDRCGFDFHEVQFGSSATNPQMYANKITEIYATAGEVLNDTYVINPPPLLQSDLCDRRYTYVSRGSGTVRMLEDKNQFKLRVKPRRSPDDGDAAVLALAPENIFEKHIGLMIF